MKILIPRKSGIIFLHFIILGFLVFPYSNIAYSENISEPSNEFPPDKTLHYKVEVLLTRVGEIDKQIGEYELDFWLTIISEDVDFTVSPPDLDFTNGKITKIDSPVIEPHYYEARYEGKFWNEFDFRSFPFEKYDLVIEIEPKSPYTIEYLVLDIDDDSGIDRSARVPGWALEKMTFVSSTHDYEDMDNYETYSRHVSTYSVERSALGSVMKTIFPVTIITAISLISFWIPENYTPRIYLTTPTLLALVYLHMTNLSALPPLGYMTIFDKIMVSYYALFFNSILAIGIQMRFHYNNMHDYELRANKIMRKLIPIIGIGAFLLLLPF